VRIRENGSVMRWEHNKDGIKCNVFNMIKIIKSQIIDINVFICRLLDWPHEFMSLWNRERSNNLRNSITFHCLKWYLRVFEYNMVCLEVRAKVWYC
jgi:hypothetical protein